MKIKILFIFLFSLIILTGCSFTNSDTNNYLNTNENKEIVEENQNNSNHLNNLNNLKEEVMTIMIIPLDNRPANTYFPLKIGESGGAKILLPPNESLKSHNELKTWISDNAEKTDAFVVSIDMLAYGGLVESREHRIDLNKAIENLDIIKELKDTYPNKKIYAYNSIQRLAVSAMKKKDMEYYNKIRKWTIMYDKVHNFNFIELKEDLINLENSIPKNIMDDYLEARNRNHIVNKTMIDWINEGYMDYLILGQDDASEYGIHRVEGITLDTKVKELNLEHKIQIMPGIDELDMVLISRLINEELNTFPTYFVVYSGKDGKDWIAPFDDKNLDLSIDEHLKAAKSKRVHSIIESDIVMYVNTPPDNENDSEMLLKNFISHLYQSMIKGKQIVIVDVNKGNTKESNLFEMLYPYIDLKSILNYTSWNTASNSIGIAIGHSSSRYAFTMKSDLYSRDLFESSSEAHLEFLFHRYAKDYFYKQKLNQNFKDYASSLNVSYLNLEDKNKEVTEYVQEHMLTDINRMFKEKFFDSNVFVGTMDNKKVFAKIKSLDSIFIGLPWNRLFDANIEPNFNLQFIYE